MPSVLQRTSPFATALVGVGLLTCVYLAALKLLDVACPLAGCANIINTHYGSLFRVPLPLYAIPLWLTLAVRAERPWQNRVQLASLLALALGAAVLMGIQFLVLRGFCPFCTLHAAAAITAAFVVPRRGHAHPWLPAVILALVLPILFAVKVVERAKAQSWTPPEEVAAGAAGPAPAATPAIPPSVDKAAFAWLGDFDAATSPTLVVSFQCTHCLDLLEEVLTHPHDGTLKGPKVFVYAAHGFSGDTVEVLAAILSVPGTPQEQFATVFGHLDAFRDALITHDSVSLRDSLAGLFPGYTAKIDAARQRYNLDVVALKYIPGRGSPYVVFPDGTSKFGGDVVPSMLFR